MITHLVAIETLAYYNESTMHAAALLSEVLLQKVNQHTTSDQSELRFQQRSGKFNTFLVVFYFKRYGIPTIIVKCGG